VVIIGSTQFYDPAIDIPALSRIISSKHPVKTAAKGRENIQNSLVSKSCPKVFGKSICRPLLALADIQLILFNFGR